MALIRRAIFGALALACIAGPALAQQSVIVRKPDNSASVDVANSANQTAPQATPGSDASKAVAVQGVTGGKAVPVTYAFPASGVTPVTGALSSATSSGIFTPVAGRAFNVSAWGTFTAAFQLERSFDSGTTWLPITAAGTQLYQWTAPESESAEETEAGVQYRLRVTSYSSGTINVRLSQ